MTTGAAAFEAFAQQLAPKLTRAKQEAHQRFAQQQAAATESPTGRTPPADTPINSSVSCCTDVRALVELLVKELVSCVAMGAAMPQDAKHRQHLSKWVQWKREGSARRGLQLDCAGLTLAVYCLSHLLAALLPDLANVAFVVCFCLIAAVKPGLLKDWGRPLCWARMNMIVTLSYVLEMHTCARWSFT
jgi:hypothetical protein